MNIANHIERGRELYPLRTALICEGRSVTYEQVERSANLIANGLVRLGIERGDRVSLFLPNTPELVYAYLAILKLGAIAVFLNPAVTRDELAGLVADSMPKAIFVTPDLFEKARGLGDRFIKHRIIVGGSDTLREANSDLLLSNLVSVESPEARAVDLPENSPAVIVYTSGTTGVPKGVVLSHGNVVSNIKAKKEYLAISGDDRLLLFLPLFHCFGQNAILNAGLYSGASIVLHGRFDPDQVARSIIEDKVTMFFGVPANYTILLDLATPEILGSLRYFFSAAASLPADIEEKWRQKFGLPIHQGYGLTETSPFCSYNHHHRYRPGSIGTPISGVEMKVIDVENGDDLGTGQSGEIVVKGPNVMLGYWNHPEETAESIRDGWLHTGDIGRMDQDGYFYIDGRLKEMINVGGQKVYPAEVENVLLRSGFVAEAGVCAAPNPVLGEHVSAAVVLKPGDKTDQHELITFCREHLAPYKVPDSVAFVDSLPKTSTGKLVRSTLKEMLLSSVSASLEKPHLNGNGKGARNSGPSNSCESIRAWLEGWLRDHADACPNDLDQACTFADYGLSSISMVTMVEELGESVGRRLEPTLAWTCPSISSLSRHVASIFLDEEPRPANGPLPDQYADPNGTFESDLTELSASDLAKMLELEIAAARERRAK